MAQAFSFKPALLGARCEVRVDAVGAVVTRGDRKTSVRFADVTSARFVEISMRTSSVSLVLMHRNGKFAYSYGGRVSEAAGNAEAAGFVASAVAVLEGLAAVKPEAEVALGGGPGLRWTMAVMGVVMAVLGALMALIPFGQGTMDGEGVVVVILAAVIAIGGVGLAVRYNPLGRLPSIKAGELAALLRRFVPEAPPI